MEEAVVVEEGVVEAVVLQRPAWVEEEVVGAARI